MINIIIILSKDRLQLTDYLNRIDNIEGSICWGEGKRWHMGHSLCAGPTKFTHFLFVVVIIIHYLFIHFKSVKIEKGE